MADIDSIISGVSGNTRADFSALADIPKAYWEGQERRAKTELRDAFKGGVPTLPDGSIDYATMQRTLYQKGALDQGNSLSGISARAGELEALRGADGSPQATLVSPPSANRTASAVVAPPLNKGGEVPQGQAQAPQGQPQAPQQPAQPPTIMTVLAAQGIPNHQLQAASDSIARQLGTDPTAPLNLQDPQVRNVLAPAVAQLKRAGIGEVVQQQPPQQPQVMAQGGPAPIQPSPEQAAAQNDPLLKRLTLLSASQDKQIAAAAKVRLESYLKNKELTPDQKNAAASGKTVEEYQARAGEEAANLAILKDSIIPKLDTSHKAAESARDEISAIYRAREQLDAAGGILSGSFSDQRLKMVKFAEMFGVPNADRIANTETFKAAIGSRVLAMVKVLGVNPSNGDRIFAEKMAGGNIDLNESSIRRILEIGEKAARSKIDTHNTSAGKIIKSNEALKGYKDVYAVEAPGPYEGKKAEAKGQSNQFNSPADVHAAIKAGKLQKGDSFTDSNGKTRLVP